MGVLRQLRMLILRVTRLTFNRRENKEFEPATTKTNGRTNVTSLINQQLTLEKKQKFMEEKDNRINEIDLTRLTEMID